MTKVLCGFKDCVFIKDYDPDEEIGVCSKEEIVLDEAVEDVIVGCPDAEWKAEADDDSAFEEYKDEVRKEYEYLHWDIS